MPLGSAAVSPQQRQWAAAPGAGGLPPQRPQPEPYAPAVALKAALNDPAGMRRGAATLPAQALGAPMDVVGLLTAAAKAAAGGTMQNFGANAALPGGSEHLMQLGQRAGLLPQMQGTPGEAPAVLMAGMAAPSPRLRLPLKGTKGQPLTLERVSAQDAWGSFDRLALQERTQSPVPKPLDLDAIEQDMMRREADAVGFSMRDLESSDDLYGWTDPGPLKKSRDSALYSDNPLIEAIVTGATKDYDQTWAIRDSGEAPRWLINSALNVDIVDGREVPFLTIDIASQDRASGEFRYATDSGYNDIGVPALRDAVTNILGWYHSLNIRPEYIGGLRVRQGRGDVKFPASKLKTELTKGWVALFGAGAVMPRIIIDGEGDSNGEGY